MGCSESKSKTLSSKMMPNGSLPQNGRRRLVLSNSVREPFCFLHHIGKALEQDQCLQLWPAGTGEEIQRLIFLGNTFVLLAPAVTVIILRPLFLNATGNETSFLRVTPFHATRDTKFSLVVFHFKTKDVLFLSKILLATTLCRFRDTK